jgi:hypothetical protein
MTKDEIADLVSAVPQGPTHLMTGWMICGVESNHVQKSAQKAEFCVQNGLG